MANIEKYRPNVGIVLFNKDGDIWFGKRADIKSKSAWQMPQGGIDINEPSLKAAIRELYEETGYESKKVIKLGKVLPNPALMGNYAHTFLALNAKRTGLQKLDGMEDIEIVEIPIEDIPKLIESGKIEHSIVISAFYLLERFNKS